MQIKTNGQISYKIFVILSTKFMNCCENTFIYNIPVVVNSILYNNILVNNPRRKNRLKFDKIQSVLINFDLILSMFILTKFPYRLILI